MSPITLEDFAEFLRSGNYFRDEHWLPYPIRPARGGDEVLHRVGYRWARRTAYISQVSWYEAHAYARWQGGRLLLSNEWSDLGFGPEWCADWFNVDKRGWNVMPDEYKRIRVAGWREGKAASPSAYMPFVFRVKR